MNECPNMNEICYTKITSSQAKESVNAQNNYLSLSITKGNINCNMNNADVSHVVDKKVLRDR